MILGMFIGMPVSISQYHIIRENPLKKLSESLIVIQEYGCDGETVKMFCQDENKISIQSVFYGIQSKEDISCGGNKTENCSVQSAIGVVEELCQGRTSCSVKVSPTDLQGKDERCLSKG